jgi:hypothetical protein
MKKSKFSGSQIMGAVKRLEAGLSVPDVRRELEAVGLLPVSMAPC